MFEPTSLNKMDSPIAPRLWWSAFQPLFSWCVVHLLWTPAVRPGDGRPFSWRALFEQSELDRPPESRGRPITMRSDWTSMVLGPFAETKGPRLPGRNPATSKIAWTWSFDKRVRRFVLNKDLVVFKGYVRWIPAKNKQEYQGVVLLVPVDHVAGGDGEGSFGHAGGERFKVEGRGFHVFSCSSGGIGQRALFLH